MLRRGCWKYVHTEGDRVMLFDMENDPDEVCDLWTSPDHADVRAELSARVLEGWDAGAIQREVDLRCAEKTVLRDWGRQTNPKSTAQYAIKDSDSWLDEPT